MICCPARTQSLQSGTNHIDIPHVLGTDPGDICPAVRDDLNESLQLKLPESLSDRRAGDAHLLSDCDLLQLLMLLVFAIENVLSQLTEDAPSE